MTLVGWLALVALALLEAAAISLPFHRMLRREREREWRESPAAIPRGDLRRVYRVDDG